MDAIYRSIASLVMGLMSAMGIQPPPATWQLQVLPDGKTAALTISDHPHSTHGTSVPIEQFDGLKPLLPASGPAKFRLKRDAGTFEFDGVLRGGAGGGTLEFVPSDTFAAELAKRGFDKPTRGEQYKMAWHDTGFAVIDELAALKYQRPTLQQLISAGDHGVDRAYLRELSAQGYRLGTVDALVRLRDHGVGGDYVRDLASLGLKGLSADDLVRARDHGVGPEYVRDLRALGYTLTLDELVRARDHGVSPGWARNVNGRHSMKLSLDQLVSLRDHGVETLDALRRQTHAS
jgi:hypothetical protein